MIKSIREFFYGPEIECHKEDMYMTFHEEKKVKTITICGYIIPVRRIVAIGPIIKDENSPQWCFKVIISGMDSLIVKSYERYTLEKDTQDIKEAMELA